MAPTFTGPATAPMMTAPPAPDQALPPEPDDIPEPAVPAAVLETPASTPQTQQPEHFGVHEALLQGFCQALQSRMHAWMKDEHRAVMGSLEAVYAHTRDYAEKVLHANEHALYSLANALIKMQEDGLSIIQPPYQVKLQVETAAGYPMELTLTKSTAAALIEELGRLEPWLQSHGYKPGTIGDYA